MDVSFFVQDDMLDVWELLLIFILQPRPGQHL